MFPLTPELTVFRKCHPPINATPSLIVRWKYFNEFLEEVLLISPVSLICPGQGAVEFCFFKERNKMVRDQNGKQ